MTVRTANELVARAREEVPVIDVEQAKELFGRDDVVFVDVRETGEYEQGHVPHAVHVPRGLLEWYADPTLPVHKAELRSGRKLVRLLCLGRPLAARGQDAQGHGHRGRVQSRRRLHRLEGGRPARRAVRAGPAAVSPYRRRKTPSCPGRADA